MATISAIANREYVKAYDGYDHKAVGIGLATGVDPNSGKATDDIYATRAYAKSKVQSLPLGLISKVVYSGFNEDPNPLILPIAYEPQYNTIMAYSLRYATPVMRRAILKFILEQNLARIKSNQPLMVDYSSLKSAIPDSQWILRRYKVVGIRVQETFQLNEWAGVAAKKTPFDGRYREFKAGKR